MITRRSFKKRPIEGNCGGSEKQDKRQFNRGFRAVNRSLIDKGWFDYLPERKNPRYGKEWTFQKDGKHYCRGKKLLRE